VETGFVACFSDVIPPVVLAAESVNLQLWRPGLQGGKLSVIRGIWSGEEQQARIKA
jgi:hypothetical protein